MTWRSKFVSVLSSVVSNGSSPSRALTVESWVRMGGSVTRLQGYTVTLGSRVESWNCGMMGRTGVLHYYKVTGLHELNR